MSYAPTQRPLTARSNSSSDMAPLHLPSLHRHRKTVSTGGGRAWSEAEEAYLIETRERKMPYKHIAAQLKKTELACRLHYHQLSFGSKSRRSNGNSHPAHGHYERSSMTPQPPSFRASPQAQRPLPSFSPPASPPDAIQHHPAPPAATAADLSHKPILPKPFNTSPYNRATTSSPRGLRLVTDDLPAPSESRTHYVDVTRLDRLYDAHRLHFWSTIASEYGGNLSPATLEDAWRRAHGMRTGSNFPPTPRGSPHSALPPNEISVSERQPSILTTPYSAVTDPGKFTSVNRRKDTDVPRSAYPTSNSSNGSASNERRNGMSVTSLLTENKDVRSPGREKGAEEAMDLDRPSSASGSQSRELPLKRELTPSEPPVNMTETRITPIATTA